MARYTAIFERNEDGSWSGFVPDLPAILASGDTLEQARQSMREGIKIWIEEAKKDGSPIPPPSTVALSIEAVV